MTAWRYRRCPACLSVFPGGQLRPVRYGASHWHEKGGSLRRCPSCGYVIWTSKFEVVADRRANRRRVYEPS